MHQAAKTLLGENNDIRSILFFDNPSETGKIIKTVLRKGVLILVKGSQSMRMEKVIEEIIADPEKIPELLCRQSKAWKNKEFKEV